MLHLDGLIIKPLSPWNKFKKRGKTHVIFLGNNKVQVNLKDDDNDTSEKTMQLLLKDHTSTTDEYKRVRELLKLSDRDGKWAEYYDSVFIGNFESNDDNANNLSLPYWVIKTYEQQTPLTYHIMKV